MPILGMQGIANSLVSQAGSGQTSKGTGEAGLETNQATVPPPGFAPPGLTQATAAGQKVPATTEGRDHVTSQASQTGQTSQQLPVTSVATTTASEICVDLSQCEQTSQTSLTTQTGTSSSVAPPTTSAASTSPIQATFEHVNQSSTHPASSSTYPSEVAGIPSDSPEPTAVVVDREPTRAVLSNGGSVRSRISSSSVSSHSDNTSSLSSEGESLQLSRKYGSRGDSCLADSENEAKVKFSSGRSDFVPGEGQLFFSGGAVSPAWAKEKAFIKRCVCVCEQSIDIDVSLPTLPCHRVRLTVDYSLCVLRHDDKAYFLSSEVSEWFWECDLLQSMLRQVQKPCWGLIITEKKNKKLFQTLRRVHFTSRFILSRQQITVYALEE